MPRPASYQHCYKGSPTHNHAQGVGQHSQRTVQGMPGSCAPLPSPSIVPSQTFRGTQPVNSSRPISPSSHPPHPAYNRRPTAPGPRQQTGYYPGPVGGYGPYLQHHAPNPNPSPYPHPSVSYPTPYPRHSAPQGQMFYPSPVNSQAIVPHGSSGRRFQPLPRSGHMA
jgi:hypothetical protein